MKYTAEKLIKEMDEMLDVVSDKFMKESNLIDEIIGRDPDLFVLLKHTFKMLDISKELLIEQAEALDDINSKLDKLLLK